VNREPSVVLASPPARSLEIRVAESPLVSIRFHLDNRLGDLAQVLQNVEAERHACVETRSRLREQLRRNEEARRELLLSIHRQSMTAVRRCLREGLDFAAELGRAEERLLGLDRLRSSLIHQAQALREVVQHLDQVMNGSEIEIDGRASRFSQATRRVFQLVGHQHDAVRQALLEGPLQRLSEAVLDVEVAVREAPEQEDAAREKVGRCRDATHRAREDVERLIRGWRPLHDEKSPVEAIGEILTELGSVRGYLRVVGAERRLPFTVELAVYRIAEEAIGNALRHGHPSHIDVVLGFRGDRLALLVKDDGEGFDVVATEARLGRSRGLGLIAMRTRAEICDGQFDVRSVTGAGTEVRATLPVTVSE